MKSVNIQDAKTHLSRHLRRVKRGETLVICDRNTPVAELRPLTAANAPKRPLGALRGAVVHMADTFNDPLSGEELVAFTHGNVGAAKS
jgi:antitoxin (DNA-binding transcriptional repressor) of toxin-antitoxin stability system